MGWKDGNDVRRSLGLDAKEFHITVGGGVSDHSITRGLDKLVFTNWSDRHRWDECVDCVCGMVKVGGKASLYIDYVFKLMNCAPHMGPEWERLVGTWMFLLMNSARYEEVLDAAQDLLAVNSRSSEALIRFADAKAKMGEWASAMATYYKILVEEPETDATKNERINNYLIGCLAKGVETHGEIHGCRLDLQDSNADKQPSHPDFEPTFAEWPVSHRAKYYSLLPQIQSRIRYTQYTPPLGDNIDRYTTHYNSPTTTTTTTARFTTLIHRLPRNFSSLIPFFLYSSSTPRHGTDIHVLSELGIGLVVTLTEEQPLQPKWFDPPIKNVFVCVRNYMPPSVNQMDGILWEMAKEWGTSRRGILVHCGGGKGRAGTVLACYLVRFGMAPIPALCDACLALGAQYSRVVPSSQCAGALCTNTAVPVMSAQDAVALLRNVRPGSIETKEQEDFVRAYADWVWKQVSGGVDPTVDEVLDAQNNRVSEEILDEEVDELRCIGDKRVPSVVLLVGLPGSGKFTEMSFA